MYPRSLTLCRVGLRCRKRRSLDRTRVCSVSAPDGILLAEDAAEEESVQCYYDNHCAIPANKTFLLINLFHHSVGHFEKTSETPAGNMFPLRAILCSFPELLMLQTFIRPSLHRCWRWLKFKDSHIVLLSLSSLSEEPSSSLSDRCSWS